MTVEAAVVLPLFLFFVFQLSCAVELIRLHGNLQLALWNTGRSLAIYGHALEDNRVASMFGGFYLKEKLIEYAGADYLNKSLIEGGASGLIPWESSIFPTSDEMDLIVTYQVSPEIPLIGFGSFRMANRYYSHLWNGYDLSDPEEELSLQSSMVYITESGEVYHEDPNCTHLFLSVRAASWEEAIHSTNGQGSSYTPCERCGPQPGGTVYLTNEGQRYHASPQCSGLKRTVYSVSRSQISGYRACSRCG